MVAVLTPTSASTERPMALSMREAYTPPCSVPLPFRWMSLTSIHMTARPGSTSSTFASMCLEKVTSSSKYRVSCSSCSSLIGQPFCAPMFSQRGVSTDGYGMPQTARRAEKPTTAGRAPASLAP